MLGVIREGSRDSRVIDTPGGVCRQPMSHLPGPAQRDVVTAVHLVRVDAKTLTCVPARPRGREHAIVTAEEAPAGVPGQSSSGHGSCNAFESSPRSRRLASSATSGGTSW